LAAAADGIPQSIWSTTGTFGYHNLVYTMLGIGALTYLVVFNVNLLVSFSKLTYSSLKVKIISSMQADSRNSWKKRGELFHKYKPRQNSEQSKPSEWWIIVYFLQRGLDVVFFRGQEKSEEGGQKGRRKWFGRMIWKSRKKSRESTMSSGTVNDTQA
jgi:hypothetical protein